MSTPYKSRSTAARKARKAHNPSPARPRDRSKRKRVYRLSNGLISLLKTPEELIPVARSNSVASPLLRLPAEIRVKIWSYVLGGTTFVLRTGYHSSDNDGYSPVPQFQATFNIPASTTIITFDLLRVCRQIYAETALLYCSLNTFIFVDYITFPVSLVKSTLAHRHAIRKIYVPRRSTRCGELFDDLLEYFPNVEEIVMWGYSYEYSVEEQNTVRTTAKAMKEKTGRMITARFEQAVYPKR